MSNDVDIKELIQLADSLLNGKEMFVSSVVDRIRKAASKYPHDQAIRTLQVAVEQRFKKEGSLGTISQAEIQSYYDDVSGLGNRTHFTEELGDLLLEDRVGKVAHYDDEYVKGLRNHGESLDIYDNQRVGELQGLWGEPNTAMIRSASAENGRRGIEIELESLGFSQPSVEVTDYNDNFIVFAAEVGTRKGRVPFLIPTEVKEGSVLMPSVFVSGDEFRDLTADNLHNHVNSDITKMKHATPKAILTTLNSFIAGPDVVKEAAGDFAAPLSGPEFYMDHLGHTDPSVNRDYIDEAAPQVPLPPALQGLGEDLIRETLVEAGLSYDRETVLTAKQIVSNELKLANISFDTIKVASEFDGGITLAVNIGGKGGKKKIEVPVEVVEGSVLMPSSFISGPMAGSFDESGLNAFANQVEGEARDPFLTDKFAMTYPELHKLVLKKAAYGDFIEATDSLNIINEKFGPDFHRAAHEDLLDLLKVGYGQDDKPLTAMERFAEEAALKAADKESQIKMTGNTMLFYPAE